MYVPKDHWMVCSRCGAKFRYSDMKEEWTGLWVCTECFEIRHPQDSVTGIADDPSVPVTRPDVVQTMGETTLNGALTKGVKSATLTVVSGLSDGDPVGIVLDDDTVHWTFIDGALVGSVITLGSVLPFAAADGNIVYLPSLDNETWT